MINELVKILSKGKHEVVIGHRDELPKGGTELEINVDLNNTNVKELDFEQKIRATSY